MRILIEEYQYSVTDEKRQSDLRTILKELGGFENVEGKISINYVGYYYSTELKDCVFILPKVLLTFNDEIPRKELVFGKYKPDEIINVDKNSKFTEDERRFIYEFAVWIYRAIDVYHHKNKKSNIIYFKQIAKIGHGRRRVSNTFLDVLLSLIQFNKDNQNFLFYILKNLHSGLNKINWTRTITKSQAYIDNNSPVYINPINKKRRVNFDEELLVIFFSILNYINNKYGFNAEININYPLIPKVQFENYLRGMGKTRLLQIKYKYFSDKAIQLWELCYAFFERAHEINISTEIQEYLLAKDFNIVFESMIDELVGDIIPTNEKRLKELKEQPDGKMVDHIYQWQTLTNNEDADKIVYYIGDSKYYKKGTPLGKESVYKQFTYARNVIQWNLDLFNDGTELEKEGHVLLRDDVTEGYNIIPNFFISAHQDTLKKEDNIRLTDKGDKYFFSRHFENRLFDRDTFLIAHYDVNFLFIVALYGRNNTGEKASWKKKVRDMFRNEIQAMLKEKFLFYALTPHENVNADQYIRENFQLLLGKVFKPFDDVGDQQYFSLALRNPEALTRPEEKELREKIETENEGIRQVIDQYFYRAHCELGTNPADLKELPKVVPTPVVHIPKEFRTQYFFEAFPEATFLMGCYKNTEHLRWIFDMSKPKRDIMYNIRIGKERDGAISKNKAKKAPDFVFIYNVENPTTEGLMPFKVHHAADTPNEFMAKTGYPNPQGNYVSYVLENTPITFGDIDIVKLLDDYQSKYPDHKKGEPIYLLGKEMINYRKK